MDVNSLFQALTNASTTAAKDNPFQPFEDTSNQVGQLILQQAGKPQNSLGETIVASLLDGLVGGVGSHLSDNYAANQNELARNVLQDAMSGKALSRPDGMNPSVFSGLENSAQLYNMQKQADAQDAIQKAAITTKFGNPSAADYLQRHGTDVNGLALGKSGTGIPTLSSTGGVSTLDPVIAAALPSVADNTNTTPGTADPKLTAVLSKDPSTYTTDDLATLIQSGHIGEARTAALDLAAGDKVSGNNIFDTAQKKVAELDPSNPKNRAQQTVIQSMANNFSTEKQIEGLKGTIDTLAPSWVPTDFLKGTAMAAENYFDPSSDPAIYQKSLPGVADKIFRSLNAAGRGSVANLQQIKDSISLAAGYGPEALKRVLDNYKADIDAGTQAMGTGLVAGGYSGADPIQKALEAANGGANGAWGGDSAGVPSVGGTFNGEKVIAVRKIK